MKKMQRWLMTKKRKNYLESLPEQISKKIESKIGDYWSWAGIGWGDYRTGTGGRPRIELAGINPIIARDRCGIIGRPAI